DEDDDGGAAEASPERRLRTAIVDPHTPGDHHDGRLKNHQPKKEKGPQNSDPSPKTKNQKPKT
ncbi:MAG: hypothetical protein ACN6PE_24025, partial [Achromobacter marplatensis]|uniref:hypothetical protein n=1 Tax=Achromobacter marplatensis TaxID=470868 RepID=UPI003CFFCED7